MDRILRNTPTTLNVVFTDDDGNPQDTDDSAATVTITGGNGTALFTDASATREDVGKYSFVMPGQANLNYFDVEWHGTFNSQPATVPDALEVVGGFIYSLPALRSFEGSPISNATKYPDQLLIDERNRVEDEFQRACSRAFVQRYAREVLTGDGTHALVLAWPEVSKVLSLTVNGVDVLNTYTIVRDRDDAFVLLRRGGRWPGPGGGTVDPFWEWNGDSGLNNWDNIVIEYEYGPAYVPNRIVDAAKRRSRSRLVSSLAKISERATVMTVEGFGIVSLATPGLRGSRTGIPEVDIVLDDYDLGAGGGIH